MASALSEQLPLLCRWRDESGDQWQKYELPGTGAEGEDAISEELVLSVRYEEKQPVTARICLTEGIPRPVSTNVQDEQSEVADGR